MTGSDTETDSGTADDGEPSEELLEEVHELFDGLWSGQVVYAGVKLGLFEFVDDEPTAASTAAEQLDLDPEYTYRLLRALAQYGAMDAHGDGRFSLTEAGAFFREDHPESAYNQILSARSPEVLSAMTHLPDVVRDGGPSGFVREHGCGTFEYAEQNPEFGTVFHSAMTEGTKELTPVVMDALEGHDFEQFSHVCDVGGGHGHTLCHLLEAHPHLEGTVLELPGVVDAEVDHWAPELGVEGRCEYVAGDMFESVPRADAYFLKFVLHDWTDGDCIEILSTIREAAPPDGRVFVVEWLMPDPAGGDPEVGADVSMMVMEGGRERTEAEYRSLLERAGWEFVRTWTADDEERVSVVEATAD